MKGEEKYSVVQATKWSGLTELSTKVVAPITNMILARVLTPNAFGVIATLTMVISFAEIFTDAGFQKYLVQHRFESEEDLNTSTNVAFWTNFAFSLFLWMLISIFATPISRLTGSPNTELGISVMSFQIPLLSFSSIQMARFRRAMDFKSLFVARITTALIPIIITVPLALILKNYWALIIGTLARDVVNAIILTIKSKWKPKLEYSVLRLKQMLSFSVWTILENVSIWATAYADTFIVGAVLSSYYLGLYKTTMTTTNAYMNIITMSVMPVLFSALSKYQDFENEFRRTFFRFQQGTAILIFPLGFGLYVYRELATAILLGGQWTQTADFLGLWSLTSALTIVFSNFNSEIFRSKGKPILSVFSQVLHLALLVPVVLWGANQNYRTLTIARSLVRLVFISPIIVWFSFKISFIDVIKNVWPSLLSAVLMSLTGLFLKSLMIGMLWEIVTIVLCALIYFFFMILIPSGRKQLSSVPIAGKVINKFLNRIGLNGY